MSFEEEIIERENEVPNFFLFFQDIALAIEALIDERRTNNP